MGAGRILSVTAKGRFNGFLYYGFYGVLGCLFGSEQGRWALSHGIIFICGHEQISHRSIAIILRV